MITVCADFGVDADPKGRIFGGELAERGRQLLLIRLGPGFDGDLDDRVWKLHPLEDHLAIDVGQRIAGRGVLEPDQGHDVAGAGVLDLLARVGVHLQDPADPLALPLDRVHHVGAALDHAGVHPDERQGPDERIGHDLEGERRKRLAVVGASLHDLVRIGFDALDRRNVERRRQIVDHRVEERLHALVLEGRAAQHRHQLVRERALADAALEGRRVRLLATKVALERLVVELDRGLDQGVPLLLGGRPQLRRDLVELELGTEGIVLPDDCPLVDQIDIADIVGFEADRQREDQRRCAQPLADHVDAAEEVGADPIHLVDEADPRHPIFVRLPPDGFGLGLDAGDRIEHRDRPIQNPQAALDLDREVDVTGRVDDVDPVIVPGAGGRGRGDGDAPLLLLLHPVHGRGALVHLADLVRLSGVIEDALGRGRLAGIDVRHDADVAIALEGCGSGHG